MKSEHSIKKTKENEGSSTQMNIERKKETEKQKIQSDPQQIKTSNTKKQPQEKKQTRDQSRRQKNEKNNTGKRKNSENTQEKKKVEENLKQKQDKIQSSKQKQDKIQKKQPIVDEKPKLQPQIHKYWLHIIIPTVSRSGNNTNYLEKTLDSVMVQTNSPNSAFSLQNGRIKITVINHNEPGKRHQFFDSSKKKYLSKQPELSKHLEFITANAPSKANLVLNKLLPRTFLQTHDVAWSLRYLANLQTSNQLNSELILFMEDDFIMCPHGMLALAYFIEKATHHFPDWAALRASYGFNGIILKPEDLPFFGANFEEYVTSQVVTPPDHLMYYLFQKMETEWRRKLVVYRNNLFFHIGDVSSFDGRPARYNPACHQYMYDWLMENERFNNKDCPKDDISPCPVEDAPSENVIVKKANAHLGKWEMNLKMEKYPYLVDFDKTHAGLCRKHFPMCPANVDDDRENSCRKSLAAQTE